ncbi:copper transporter [Aquipuribacter nitratireducens]|uniref:Copper transporter n=1 Tax=Aquipuribacter nitratireducens TaxID=650104 RepID=A0ABW0GQG6_9MICO
MADLRYHVVSLAAVLLAMAVGVTLGAGPLRDPVGAVASSGVLEQRLERAEAEREGARADVAALDTASARLAEHTATDGVGVLHEEAVALLVLPGTPASQVARVARALQDAGAAEVPSVRLTRGWVAADGTADRAALAARVQPLLVDPDDTRPGGDTTLLAEGLADVLTAAAAAPAGTGTDARVVAGLLATSGLLEGDEALEPAAAVAVVVVAPGPPPRGSRATGAAADDPGAWVDVVRGLAGRLPVVAVEDAAPVAASGRAARPGVVAAVRAQLGAAASGAGWAARTSTVDHLATDSGSWATVLAVAASADGGQGDYGLLDTAADGPLPHPG